MSELDRVLTVDPGDYTACAYWEGNDNPLIFTLKPTQDDLKQSHEFQLMGQWRRFRAVLSEVKPRNVYIESVSVWSGNLKSQTAAIRGNLMKLSYLIGGYCAMCMEHQAPFTLISVQEWKGQLSKDAVKSRVKRCNGRRYSNDHIVDAVGIGFSIMGEL